NADKRVDDNYGEWINRLNLLLAWKSWQVGMRLDTVTYMNRPRISEFDDTSRYSAADRAKAEQQLPYRYRDTLLTQGNIKRRTRRSAATNPTRRAAATDGRSRGRRGAATSSSADARR